MVYEEEPERKRNSPIGPIIATIITAIGGIIIVYVQFVVPQKLAIQTTQTAEAKQASVLPTKISLTEIEPSITPPAFETATPSPPSTPAITLAPISEVFSTDKLRHRRKITFPIRSMLARSLNTIDFTTESQAYEQYQKEIAPSMSMCLM